MGLLRLSIAILIFIGHAKLFRMFPSDVLPYVTPGKYGGALKVLCFFIISGFFMHLLLSKKFTLTISGIKNFWADRVLRLYPTYGLMILATFIFFNIYQHYPVSPINDRHIARLDISRLEYMLYNIIGFNPAVFTDWNKVRLGWYFVNGGTWSLCVEYVLIALAPLVLIRKWSLWPALLITAIAAGYVYSHGAYKSNLYLASIFFTVGMLSYRIYQKYIAHLPCNIFFWPAAICSLGWIAIFIHLNWLLAIDRKLLYWVTPIVFAAMVPIMFHGFKGVKWDRAIGELAYSVYLLQFLTLAIIRKADILPKIHTAYAAIPLAILIAIIIHYTIDKPITRYRYKLRS